MERRLKIIFAALFALWLCCSTALPFCGMVALAASGSDILDDLGKDPTFLVGDYPDRAGDYTLQLIQLAETSDKKLLLYVYQPSRATKELNATSIRFSTGINANAHWQDYSLQLLSESGTLIKYLVKDFEVLPDALRYYDVIQLHRAWDAEIDKPIEGGTIDEVPCRVASLFTASTVDGKVTYTRTATEVIEITDKALGFCRYSNGFKLYVDSCDAHFVAFSTDRRIDKLLQADIFWKMQTVTTTLNPYGEDYIQRGELEDKSATLTYTDSVEHTGDGWFSKTYEWERIESAATFIQNEDLTAEMLADMQGKQWVLRFYETPYTLNSMTSVQKHTDITKVTILRLAFETDGKVYNLGVVDNKQSGDNIPDNNNTNETDFWGWLQRTLKKVPWWGWLIVAILICALLLPILSYIFPVIGNVVLFILKGVWWLISAPVRFIVWIVRKAKG